MKIKQRLSMVGKSFLNGNFGNAASLLLSGGRIEVASYQTGKGLAAGAKSNWLFAQNGIDYHFSYSGHESSLKAYNCCPPVAAIINRKAQAYINGKPQVLNSKGNIATGDVAAKINRLLKQPNPLQSWKQFEAQGYIYQQLFGYNCVLPIKPVGFKDNIDASSLWNIPPYLIEIKERETSFINASRTDLIESIHLVYKGKRTELALDEIFFFQDFSPSFESIITPQSRVMALRMPINNIIGAYESRNVLINYRGALGIITQEQEGQFGNIPLTDDDKTDLHTQFSRYGLRDGQRQLIITNAALKWQAMGYPTKDLMLFEEIEDDIMRCCDAFSYPSELMSKVKGSTFSNMNEAKKILYQDAIIPESESICEQWQDFFKTDGLNIQIKKDFGHVQALQEDEVQKSTSRLILNQALKIEYDAGLISLNDWLSKLGDEPIGDIGKVRSTDANNSNVPLASVIGVRGVQSVINVLTASSISPEAMASTLEIVFGISPQNAAMMTVASQQPIATRNDTEAPIINNENEQP